MAEQVKASDLKRNFLILLPILIIAMFQSAFNQFSSILAKLASVFPDVPTTAIQMVLSIPSLVSIPVSLTVGILATYILKKRLIQFGLAMMFIGGMMPIIFHYSIVSAYLCSICIGIAQGFLMSLAAALIAEHFDGHDRATAYGIKEATVTLVKLSWLLLSVI